MPTLNRTTQVRTKRTHNKGLSKLLLPVSYYVAASSVNTMFLRVFEGAKQQLRQPPKRYLTAKI